MAGQNVYDDDCFFSGYQAMRSAGSGLNEALEQPALRALLPAVVGQDVVELGCGDGSLSGELARAGARSVLGVDPSARMLELAVTRTEDARVRFVRAFAEDLQLPGESADLVVSSLALHYVPDLRKLLVRVASWLRPQGVFLASMEHPVVTAAPGRACEHGWVVDTYAEERAAQPLVRRRRGEAPPHNRHDRHRGPERRPSPDRAGRACADAGGRR